MIINRVLGKVEKHSAKEWFEANLKNSNVLSKVWTISADSRKPFSQEFILDTHNAESLYGLFAESGIQVPPIVDIASAKKLDSMYYLSGTKVARMKNPSLNLTSAVNLFRNYHIEIVPQIYLKNVTQGNMFYEASEIRSLPALETNASKLSSSPLWQAWGCPRRSQELKIDISPIHYPDGTTVKSWCLKWSVSFGNAHIDHDTAVYLINNLVGSGQTLTFSAFTMELLSAEEKEIATDKGWSLATYD